MRTKLIIALLVILAIGWLASKNNSPTSTYTPIGESPAQTSPSTVSTNSGQLMFGITDKTLPLDGISSIYITVGSVSVHHPKRGWQLVTGEPHVYDLLKLHSAPRTELMASINLPVDTYDAIRLSIDNINVVKTDKTSVQAKIPSNRLQINSNVKVFKGAVSSVLVDFLADKSMHQTGDGKIIFAPVVMIETKSETRTQITPIAGSINKKVEFLGGNTNYNATIGMDITGVTRINDSINPLADLEIVNGVIRIIPKK